MCFPKLLTLTNKNIKISRSQIKHVYYEIFFKVLFSIVYVLSNVDRYYPSINEL